MEKKAYIYILTNSNNSVLYIGVTSNIAKRIAEHKNHTYKGFSDKYNCTKLVYFEDFSNIKDAIKREKQLKKYYRKQKLELIETFNPEWNDLYYDIIQ